MEGTGISWRASPPMARGHHRNCTSASLVRLPPSERPMTTPRAMAPKMISIAPRSLDRSEPASERRYACADMARMVPFPMLPTASSAERRLYEAFLSQLGDEYVVYHSVPWNLQPDRRGGPRVEGEADFVIAHPEDGILVLEAKGGELSYDPQSKRWFQAGREGKHPLDEDPFHQARDEMHSLVGILSHQPGWERWKPWYGYGVAFPDCIDAAGD